MKKLIIKVLRVYEYLYHLVYMNVGLLYTNKDDKRFYSILFIYSAILLTFSPVSYYFIELKLNIGIDELSYIIGTVLFFIFNYIYFTSEKVMKIKTFFINKKQKLFYARVFYAVLLLYLIIVVYSVYEITSSFG